MSRHRLQIGGWVGADPHIVRDHLLFASNIAILNHEQALELLVSVPDLRSLFAAAVGPARVQSVQLDVAAPAVWENEGGACLADTD